MTAEQPQDEASLRTSWKLRARWVWDGTGFLGEDHVVEIEAGHITAIHSAAAASAVDLGNVVILPGLVNAHTHLEFSNLRHPLPYAVPFTRWVRDLIQFRREQTEESSRQSVLPGLRESASAGSTLVGEITTSGNALPELSSGDPRVVSFREIIGLDPAGISLHRQTAEDHLDDKECPPESRMHLKRGISPHAPYSVHRELLSELVRLAADRQVPLAMHLAETRGELQLLRHGTGEFQQLLAALGVWREGLFPSAGLGTPLEYLKLLARAPSALVIHGNYLDETSLRLLADCPQLTLVYCPRTHAYFRHARHPWQRLEELGGRVVLGTDSRGSSPDLSIWRELCFLARRHPDLSSSRLLPLATRQPPGLQVGQSVAESTVEEPSLQAGAPADLTLIRLPDGTGAEIERSLLRSAAEVCGTMRAGRWISHPPAGNSFPVESDGR